MNFIMLIFQTYELKVFDTGLMDQNLEVMKKLIKAQVAPNKQGKPQNQTTNFTVSSLLKFPEVLQ